jgi:hypothetical protein
MLRAIDISDLPQPLIDAIETIVREYRERGGPPAGGPRPPVPVGGASPFRKVTPLRVSGTAVSELLIQDRR